MDKSTPGARVGNVMAEESQVRSSILIPLAQLFKWCIAPIETSDQYGAANPRFH